MHSTGSPLAADAPHCFIDGTLLHTDAANAVNALPKPSPLPAASVGACTIWTLRVRIALSL
jgi:hypothetical protein